MRSQKTRRWVIGAATAVVATAVAMRELSPVLRRPYRRTPYDDLLSKLPDRDSSVVFGRAVALRDSAAAIAAVLRQRLRHDNLQTVSARELSQGQVLVAGGWVVPRSLALICVLAARET